MLTARIATLSFFFLAFLHAGAQEIPPPSPKNAIYIEGLGTGGWASLNYERFLVQGSLARLALRAGFSTYKTVDFTNSFNPDLIFPFALNMMYGKKHQLEIGIGQTFTSTVETDESAGIPKRVPRLHAGSLIGYRYMQTGGGLMVRAGYTPVLEENKRFRHWAGFSVGFIF